MNRYSHNWWHVAVCYLEGGSPLSKVQEIYDHQMCKELEKEDAVATDVNIPYHASSPFKKWNIRLPLANSFLLLVCIIEFQVYMDALGLLLRLDTRDQLDEFLDRLKILANCLTDQVSNSSVLPCIYLHFF